MSSLKAAFSTPKSSEPIVSAPSEETPLFRLSRSSLNRNTTFTSVQNQTDHIASGFLDQAFTTEIFAPLMAGTFAYRLGRLGVMGSRGGPVTAMPLRKALSIGLGTGAEVVAYEFTHRSLLSLTQPLSLRPPSLWTWSGPHGWKEGLAVSGVTFSLLKGAGGLSRGQNIVVRHLFQDAAMVAGQQAAGALHFIPKPEGSWAEQFAHAEVVNIQLAGGMGLLYRLATPLSALERATDISFPERSSKSLFPGNPFKTDFPEVRPATAAEGPMGPLPKDPSTAPKGPPTFFMKGNWEGPLHERGSGNKEGMPLDRMLSILSGFPEISKRDLSPVVLRTKRLEIEIPRTLHFRPFGQLLRRLQSAALPPPLAASLEEILWRFEPPHNGGTQESMEQSMEDLSRKLLLFYMENRDQIYSLSDKKPLDFETLRKKDEEAFEPFWELNAFPDSRIEGSLSNTEAVFAYVARSKDPLYLISYAFPGGDMQRMIVPQKVFDEISHSLNRKGEFSFSTSKENSQGALFTLTRENFFGSFPLTPYTITQLALEPILSPSLFKALFGLMDHILTAAPHPELAEEVKKDLQRTALHFYLGGDEARVLEGLRERVLKKYYQNRDIFLDRIDFLRYEENLPFLADLPPSLHLLSKDLRDSMARFVDGSQRGLPLNRRAISVLGLLRRIYRTQNQHLIRQLHYQVPADSDEMLPDWIARFYYEHEKEIWGLLQNKGEIN